MCRAGLVASRCCPSIAGSYGIDGDEPSRAGAGCGPVSGQAPLGAIDPDLAILWAACWGYDSAAVEWLFGETEELTRGFETRVQTIRVGADGRALGGQPPVFGPCAIPWTAKCDLRTLRPMHDGR
jgi:hypothetical protein